MVSNTNLEAISRVDPQRSSGWTLTLLDVTVLFIQRKQFHGQFSELGSQITSFLLIKGGVITIPLSSGKTLRKMPI